jgi:hypothetical protein
VPADFSRRRDPTAALLVRNIIDHKVDVEIRPVSQHNENLFPNLRVQRRPQQAKVLPVRRPNDLLFERDISVLPKDRLLERRVPPAPAKASFFCRAEAARAALVPPGRRVAPLDDVDTQIVRARVLLLLRLAPDRQGGQHRHAEQREHGEQCGEQTRRQAGRVATRGRALCHDARVGLRRGCALVLDAWRGDGTEAVESRCMVWSAKRCRTVYGSV